jgi:FtsH-binding integral membrane protein
MFGTKYGFSIDSLEYMLVGLFIACLYIIYDTQMVIEMSERGEKDVPTHTMILFVDLFDLFIKLVKILIKLNEDEKKKKKKEK